MHRKAISFYTIRPKDMVVDKIAFELKSLTRLFFFLISGYNSTNFPGSIHHLRFRSMSIILHRKVIVFIFIFITMTMFFSQGGDQGALRW